MKMDKQKITPQMEISAVKIVGEILSKIDLDNSDFGFNVKRILIANGLIKKVNKKKKIIKAPARIDWKLRYKEDEDTIDGDTIVSLKNEFKK